MLSYVRLVRAFVSDTLFAALARICGVATMDLLRNFFVCQSVLLYALV